MIGRNGQIRMNENTIIVPPEEQVENDRDARAEELESTFSYDGYAPCILYNLNGYYNGLKTLLDHMIETGLSTKERQEGIWFAENLEQIKRILKA